MITWYWNRIKIQQLYVNMERIMKKKKVQSLVMCLKRLKKSRPKREHKIIDRFIYDVEFYSTWPFDLSDVR